MPDASPLMLINAAAPIRICDNGGWTDTWFSGHGRIFNIAVTPCAEVQIALFRHGDLAAPVILNVLDYQQRYPYTPGAAWERHPLLEAALTLLPPPPEISIEVTLHCAAPSGASVGTSAAICVALLGALDALSSRRMSPREIAYAAHRVETELLGQQSGIQDQLCSAYGGVNFIEMDRYPSTVVTQIPLNDPLSWELERRLALIYLGKSHRSTKVHEMVIANLQAGGSHSQPLADLCQAAEQARDAMLAGDLAALGTAMSENTAAQGRLHPELVNRDARRVIEIAQKYHTLGWKVNGAGGEGGSLTVLGSADLAARQAMLAEIQAQNPLYKIIPIQLSRSGLRVWKQELQHELTRTSQ